MPTAVPTVARPSGWRAILRAMLNNNQSTNARFAQDTDSAWEWINVPGNHGSFSAICRMEVRVTLPPSIPTLILIRTAAGSKSQKGASCFAGQVTTPTDPAVTIAADLHGRVIYIWGNIALNASKTVKVSYRRF